MGHDRLEFGVKIRRFLVISIRTCYKSVCSHPFIVGMVCFFIFLYRSFPFAFSLLVSASPVWVCTAILLGTLLSFGQPNIPEIEEEEKVTHESASLKTGVAKDTTVVERDESFTIDRYVRKRDVVEDATEEARLVESQVSDVEEGSGSVDYRPLVDESSQEIQSKKQVIEELERGFDSESEKREIREENPVIEGVSSDVEVVENGKVANENLEGEDDRSLDEMNDAQMDTSPVSPWKPMRHDEDDAAADDDESLDSGSDGAESSSPDASMADIIPMLHELHPLLDSEAPQLAHMSHDGSDAASEGPNRSIDEGDESDVDTEDHGEEGDDYNYNDDDDDEEEEEEEEEEGEAQGDKEDGSKSAIKWTEDDQKNLMDLGTLELERNQRLENLIARRRARKSLRLMSEKNLIDLDDIPINVPNISTTRRNPFDLPYDSYGDMGLPPIPGSAPSILLPRRNPFDLPYDSNEEKPDLKEDSFHQEFSVSHQKEPLFRRHEGFSVGPSVLGGPKQDRQDVKLRPYFVPERLATEGTSYPSFERQLNEISESKVSSIPDTESVSSAVEEEKEKVNEQDVSGNIEMMSNADHASVHDEHESLSSTEVDSVDIEQAEKRDVHHDVVEITLGDVESHHEMESSFSEAVGAITLVELNTREIHSKSNPVEEDYNGISSLSSLSEVDEKITEVRKEEASTSLEPRSNQAVESGISAQPSLEESEFRFMSGMVDDQHKEPVYDSSPSSVEKFLSFSSVSSDNQVEISEMGSPPAMLDSLDKELEALCENTEKNASGFEDMHAVLSVHAVEENDTRSREIMEISEHDVSEVGLSGVDPRFDGRDGSMVPESVFEHVSVDSSLSSSYKERSSHYEQDQVHLSSHDAENLAGVYQDVNETSDSVASSPKVASKVTTAATGEQPPSMMVEYVSTSHAGLSSSESEHVEKHGMDMEGTLQQLWGLSESSEDGPAAEGMMHKGKNVQPEQGQALSPSSNADIHIDGHQNVGKEFSSMASIVPSSDSTLSAKEQHSPAAAKQVSDGHSSLSPPEVQHAEDHLSNKEDIFGRDQAQSSNSDAKIDTHIYGDMDVKVVSVDSSNQHVPSEEKSSSELEKQLSWSDKSMVEPFIHEDSEHREPSIISMESAEGINFAGNANLHEIHDPEDRISTNFSCLTSDSTSLPSETPEYKSPTVGEYILDGILYVDGSHVSEQLDYATEAYGSHVAQENINEEADEIKEIVEGLLSELDTIGDFSIKEVVGESLNADLLPEGTNVGSTEFGLSPTDSNLTEKNVGLPVLEAKSVEDIDSAFKQIHEGTEVEEVILPSMVEDQLAADKSEDSMEIKSELPVVEARSLEDIHIALNQVSEGNVDELLKPLELEGTNPGSTESGLSLKHSILTEKSMELPVLEARSVEDIDSAFKQIHEGTEVEEVILPSMVEDQLAADKSEDPMEIKSLPVVEARSLEDIHIALNQVSEGNVDELPKPLEPEGTNTGSTESGLSLKHSNLTEKSMELPVLEARSVEDIDSAFKQINEGTEVGEVILPSMVEDQLAADKSKDAMEIKSELPVVEARSLEEIHIALKQVSEGNVDELPKPLEPEGSKAGSTESGLSLKDSNLTEKNVELPVLEARSVEDIDSAFKQINEGAEVGEVILPSMVEDQLAADRSEDAMEIKSELPVVEARSLEEIHIALKQVSEGNVDELAKPLEPEGSKAGSTKSGLSLKDSNLKEKNVELPVLEARSVEDIDSAFKQIHEGAEVEEVILPSMVENQLAADKSEDPMQIKSELPVVEARSLEEIHIAMKQVSEGYVDELPKPLEPEGSNAGSAKSGFSPKDSNLTEKNVKLPILEVRSVEDIDSAFKQIHEGAEVEEVIFPSIVEDQLAADKSEDPMEIKSKLPVVEARYLDDIHTALKQVSEGNLDELPKRLESKCAPQEVEANDPIEFKSELPVVEAISHTALKHVSKGNLDDELPKPLESKSAPSKVKTSNLVEIKSELTVVEAGSLEGTALEQVSRGNLDELPKPLESKDVSVEVKTNIVVSTKETESSNVESGVKESSRIVGDEPKLVFEEKSENSSLSTFDRKSKKE